MFEVREDDLSSEATRALLALHLKGMYETSPPENVFALDLTGLKDPHVTVWSAWDSDRIASIGALKMLSGREAEIKSMRTHPDFLGQGAGAAILDHIIATARVRGVTRLSLETGRGEAFEAAIRLYQRQGFVEGEAFADYQPNAFSRFFHLAL